MKQNIDVVIVGGAVTGSVLALALSSVSGHQLQIAIVEKMSQTMHNKAVLTHVQSPLLTAVCKS